MGQGDRGAIVKPGPSRSHTATVQRYRIIGALALTTVFVAVKAIGHDYWAVGFGLTVLGGILLTPEPPEHAEPWRQHALRVVSACFIVVTLASIVTALT